jgi:hypothetical protein
MHDEAEKSAVLQVPELDESQRSPEPAERNLPKATPLVSAAPAANSHSQMRRISSVADFSKLQTQNIKSFETIDEYREFLVEFCKKNNIEVGFKLHMNNLQDGLKECAASLKSLQEKGFVVKEEKIGGIDVRTFDVSWDQVKSIAGQSKLGPTITKFFNKDFMTSFSITTRESEEIADICIQDTLLPTGCNKLFDIHMLTTEERQDFREAFRKLLENESGYKSIVMLMAMHELYPRRAQNVGMVNNTIVLGKGCPQYTQYGYQYAMNKGQAAFLNDERNFDGIFYKVGAKDRVLFDSISLPDFKDFKDIFHESGHAFHAMLGMHSEPSYFVWSILNCGSSSIIDLCYPLISPMRIDTYVQSLKNILLKYLPEVEIRGPVNVLINCIVSEGFLTALLVTGVDTENFSNIKNNIDDMIKLAWIYACSSGSGGLWHRSGELLNIIGLLVIKMDGKVNIVTHNQNEEVFLIRDDYKEGKVDEETKKYRFHDESDYHRHGFAESAYYKEAVEKFMSNLLFGLGIEPMPDEKKYKEMCAEMKSLISSARFPALFRFTKK